MDDRLAKLGADLAQALPGIVTGHTMAYGELTVTAKAADIITLVTHLRDDPQ